MKEEQTVEECIESETIEHAVELPQGEFVLGSLV